MPRKFEETVVWQSVLLTIWRQWTEQNTSVESCNSWRKRWKWHCLFQMSYNQRHLQLLSPGTCWTWRHSICRWLILLSRYFHHDSLPLWDIFRYLMWRTWSVQLLLLVISEIPQTAVHSTGKLQQVKLGRTIPVISHSWELFISYRKVLKAKYTSSLQGLVQCKLFS